MSPEKGEATIDVLGGLPHQKKAQTLIRSGFWMLKLCVFLVVHPPKPSFDSGILGRQKSPPNTDSEKLPNKNPSPKVPEESEFLERYDNRVSSNDIPILWGNPT